MENAPEAVGSGQGNSSLTFDTVLATIQAARGHAHQVYTNAPAVLYYALNFQYDTHTRACHERNNTPQQVLDSGVAAERAVLEVWNDVRLGCTNDPDASGARWEVTIAGVDTSPRSYGSPDVFDENGNVRDAENTFPLRVAARSFNVAFANPGPLVEKSVGETPAGSSSIPTAEQSTNSTAKSATTKRRRARKEPGNPRAIEDYGKVDDAPSWNIEFPSGNITAAEITAFLPQWLKSWDLADRFANNGAASATLAKMINTFRVMPKGPIIANSVLRMLQHSLRRRPEDRFQGGWTFGKHQKPPGWDEANLSVAGFRTPRVTYPRKGVGAQTYNRVQPPIPFMLLAQGVKAWPTGDDALDLTKCIKYHLDHPAENWCFPNDFERLVQKLGQTPVKQENWDRAIFERWHWKRGDDLPPTEPRNLEDINGPPSPQSQRPGKRRHDSDLGLGELTLQNEDVHPAMRGANVHGVVPKRQRVQNHHGVQAADPRPRTNTSDVPPVPFPWLLQDTMTIDTPTRAPAPNQAASHDVDVGLIDPALLALDEANARKAQRKQVNVQQQATEPPTTPMKTQHQYHHATPPPAPVKAKHNEVAGSTTTFMSQGQQSPSLRYTISSSARSGGATHPGPASAPDQLVNYHPVNLAMAYPKYFAKNGHRYLHTIPLPPADAQDDFWENVRWAHRARPPMHAWTTHPTDLEQATQIRVVTGWVSEERMAMWEKYLGDGEV